MTGDLWTSAHLVHHGDLSVLLLELVDPLLDELRNDGLAEQAFVLRYWDGGPHVRLRVRTAEGPAVRERILERSADFFARRPAPDALTEDEYRRSAAELGRREGVVPVERMHPNNSVRFIPYVPEHDRYGRGRALAAVEHHFDESSRLALDVLRTQPEARRRETAMVAYLQIAWLLGSSDTTATARRQLDRVRAEDPQPGEAPAALYARQRDTLRVLTTAAAHVSAGWAGHSVDTTTVRWARSVATLVDVLRSGPDAAPSGPEVVTDLCAHLLANRLGVRIDTEGSLRQLAARALLDHHDATPAPRTESDDHVA